MPPGNVQPRTDLSAIVQSTRTSLGYAVHSEVGLYGKIAEAWQLATGLVTHKPAVSTYKEYVVLKEAAALADGQQLRFDESGNYDGVSVSSAVAQQLSERFRAGMSEYLQQLKKVSRAVALESAIRKVREYG